MLRGHPFLRVAILLAPLAAHVVTARAQDDGAAPPLDPRQIGHSVASLALDVPALDPDDRHPRYEVGLGFHLQIVGGRSSWPVMIGLGGGMLLLDGTVSDGPITAFSDRPGGLTIAGTSVSSGVDLRHAELVARCQPWWGLVRPFVEVSAGLGVVWSGDALISDAGPTLAESYKQDPGLLVGASLGIDWRLHTVVGKVLTKNLVLSTGVRRWYVGPVDRPRFGVDEDGALARSEHAEWIAAWIPFVALSLTFDNTPNRRR